MEKRSWAFSKWHGLGNDFVLIRADAVPENAAQMAKKICAAHWGVGADGLIFALPGEQGVSALTMEIFNADGTVASMCGNGIRCLAAQAHREGWVEGNDFVITTRSGLKRVRLKRAQNGEQMVGVDMGLPRILERTKVVLQDVNSHECLLVSMGNLHSVVVVNEDSACQNVQDIDLEYYGSRLENSSYGACNVEIVTCSPQKELYVRVRERGVGETLACGTGACASAVAAHALKRCGTQTIVHLPGGDLRIECHRNGVLMTGPAREVFTGVITL